MKLKFGHCSSRYIPGGSWTVRHDTSKLALLNECIQSKLPIECEGYGVFADLILSETTAEGEELLWGRAKQGMCPDFRLTTPTPTGPTESLAELKFIGASPLCYLRGVEWRGTDRHASRLPAEYRKKL